MRGLLRKLDRGWRVMGTGLSFAVFMLGGSLLALVVLPACRVLPGDRHATMSRIQRVVSWSFRAHCRFMQLVRVVEIPPMAGLEDVAGRERLLLIANHPTLIDVVALISCFPEIDCVVKKALWSNRFMGGVVRAAGYIPNDEGAELLDTCLERLRQGRSILFFPEGTRSPRGGLRRFSRGAAHVALASGAKIIPIVIQCDPPALWKGQRWWQVPERRAVLTLRFGRPDAIPLPPERGDDRPVRARGLTQAMERYFRRELGYDCA